MHGFQANPEVTTATTWTADIPYTSKSVTIRIANFIIMLEKNEFEFNRQRLEGIM